MRSFLILLSLQTLSVAVIAHCDRDGVAQPSMLGVCDTATSAHARTSDRRVATSNVFGGVQLFPTNDWYNLNISGAAVAPDSDADIDALASGLSANSASGDYFQRPIGVNYINLVPYNAPKALMVGGLKGSRHTISPSMWPIADSTTLPYRKKVLAFQRNADDFIQVVQSAGGGNPNRLWSAGYVNRINSSSWQAYGGAMFNLDAQYSFAGDTGLSTSGADAGLLSPAR